MKELLLTLLCCSKVLGTSPDTQQTQLPVDHAVAQHLVPCLGHTELGRLSTSSNAWASELQDTMQMIESQKQIATHIGELCAEIYAFRYANLSHAFLIVELHEMFHERIQNARVKMQAFAEKYASKLVMPTYQEVMLTFDAALNYNTVPGQRHLEWKHNGQQFLWKTMQLGENIYVLTQDGQRVVGMVDKNRMRCVDYDQSNWKGLQIDEPSDLIIPKLDEFNLTIDYLLPLITEAAISRLNQKDKEYFDQNEAFNMLGYFFKNKSSLDRYTTEAYGFLIHSTALDNALKQLNL